MAQKKKLKDAQARQKELDEISAEDLAKIKAHQASTKGAMPVDQEWLLLAEFAKAYGWQAYLDVKNDKRDPNGNLLITGAEFLTLIEANRKLDAIQLFRDSQASLIGSGSAQSKSPSSTFKSLTKNIINQTKVEQ